MIFFFHTELFVYSVCVFVCEEETDTELSMHKEEGIGSDPPDSMQLSDQNCFLSENKYSSNTY